MQSVMPQGLYWRLSGFYFTYFMVLGAMIPYFPLYLKSLDLDAWQIGVMISVMVGTKIVAPNLWGWLADYTGRRMLVIRLGCLMAVVSFCGIFLQQPGQPSPGLLVLVIFLYSFFWNAVLAQFEAVTLFYLGERAYLYSRIRLWGSIGFIAAVALFGCLFDRIPLSFFPIVIAAGLLAIFLSSWVVEDPPVYRHTSQQDNKDFLSRLRQPHVLVFFLVCFLMVFSHGPYYTFFSLLLERHGYTRTATGLLWSFGVMAEVIIFWFMHRVLSHWGLGNVLMASLLLAGLRWVLLASAVQYLPAMLLAQCLHAFSFGAFHAAAIETVRRWFTVGQSGKAQAFYSAVGYGAGNALGSLLAGGFWHLHPALPFYVSAAACVLASGLVWCYYKEQG